MSARVYELKTAGLVTGGGPAGEVPVPVHSMAVVTVDVTAVAGASPACDFWLQGYDRFAKQWYDVPFDQSLTSNAAAADLAAGTNRRNINGTTAATGVSKHAAIYKHIPFEKVRLQWAFTGTTTSFTFSAAISGK